MSDHSVAWCLLKVLGLSVLLRQRLLRRLPHTTVGFRRRPSPRIQGTLVQLLCDLPPRLSLIRGSRVVIHPTALTRVGLDFPADAIGRILPGKGYRASPEPRRHSLKDGCS